MNYGIIASVSVVWHFIYLHKDVYVVRVTVLACASFFAGIKRDIADGIVDRLGGFGVPFPSPIFTVTKTITAD